MKPTILLIDDDQAVLDCLREFLELKGFRVDCAVEREEAEALLANRHYPLVVTDMGLTRLRGCDGLEIVEQLKQQSPETKIIVCSGRGTAELRDRINALGIDGFFQKPTPLSQLAELVQQLVEVPV